MPFLGNESGKNFATLVGEALARGVRHRVDCENLVGLDAELRSEAELRSFAANDAMTRPECGSGSGQRR